MRTFDQNYNSGYTSKIIHKVRVCLARQLFVQGQNQLKYYIQTLQLNIFKST